MVCTLPPYPTPSLPPPSPPHRPHSRHHSHHRPRRSRKSGKRSAHSPTKPALKPSLLAPPSGAGEDYRHPVREEPYDTSPIVGYLVVDKLVEHEAECGNWVKVSECS